MDTRTAQSVETGSLVLYEEKPYRVTAIVTDGLWAPYFEIQQLGLISHRLVELPVQPKTTKSKARPEAASQAFSPPAARSAAAQATAAPSRPAATPRRRAAAVPTA
jgi:hypothetical protein